MNLNVSLSSLIVATTLLLTHVAHAADLPPFPGVGVWGQSEPNISAEVNRVFMISLTRDGDSRDRWNIQLTRVFRDKGIGDGPKTCRVTNYGPYKAVITDREISIRYPVHAPTRITYARKEDGTIAFLKGRFLEYDVAPAPEMAWWFRRWTPEAMEMWRFAIHTPPLDVSSR